MLKHESDIKRHEWVLIKSVYAPVAILTMTVWDVSSQIEFNVIFLCQAAGGDKLFLFDYAYRL